MVPALGGYLDPRSGSGMTVMNRVGDDEVVVVGDDEGGVD